MMRKQLPLGTVHEHPAEDPAYVTPELLSHEDKIVDIIAQTAIKAAMNTIIENQRVLNLIKPLVEHKSKKKRQLVHPSEFEAMDFSEIKKKNARKLDFGFRWSEDDISETERTISGGNFAPIKSDGYASLALLKKDFETASELESNWEKESK
ncbi:Oidioi.mRNA.OKI2018_I69.XSR.g15532.t1.cds [Oikopleura dioica]|uniref:Oidioi.mRNA.OKI2018_I69.XSR.g15532.t1.cds n=1 Tax=Oikopleura dioica TaxID=34765 RepID=A0ABN7SD57_OIKDI|nr:Oidioi.mRNA.OKI2018_I69.XSR.g15532.t1.cds [Oikopleura dioica]